jgi:hypothetical protein
MKPLIMSSKTTAAKLLRPEDIVLNAAEKRQAKKRPGKPTVVLSVSNTYRGYN